MVLGIAGVALLTRTGPVAFSAQVMFGALACLGGNGVLRAEAALGAALDYRARRTGQPPGGRRQPRSEPRFSCCQSAEASPWRSDNTLR
ncbi:hypothetical protein ACTMU2_05465 [Cupriavidus basilensis]